MCVIVCVRERECQCECVRKQQLCYYGRTFEYVPDIIKFQSRQLKQKYNTIEMNMRVYTCGFSMCVRVYKKFLFGRTNVWR